MKYKIEEKQVTGKYVSFEFGFDKDFVDHLEEEIPDILEKVKQVACDYFIEELLTVYKKKGAGNLKNKKL